MRALLVATKEHLNFSTVSTNDVVPAPSLSVSLAAQWLLVLHTTSGFTRSGINRRLQ